MRSEWTLDTLRVHNDLLRVEAEASVEKRFASLRSYLDALRTTDIATNQLLLTEIRDRFIGLIEAHKESTATQFVAQERAVIAALSSVREATEKADKANEKRLDSVNEFRSNLKDQQATFITRGEVNAITASIPNLMTRNEMFGWVGAAGLIGGIIGHYIK